MAFANCVPYLEEHLVCRSGAHRDQIISEVNLKQAAYVCNVARLLCMALQVADSQVCDGEVPIAS